jgi:hypothetical protein
MKHYIANPLSNLELKLTRLTIFHKITLTIYENHRVFWNHLSFRFNPQDEIFVLSVCKLPLSNTNLKGGGKRYR